MQTSYQPHEIETKIYQAWEKAGLFSAQGELNPYCIMLPPPNVTGSLHMGHGFQDTLMDLLTRYHRMCGDKTLWQPGLDHAGIATQMVVERQLETEGSTRTAIGREAFTQRVFDWKDTSGGMILKQMRRLGATPDWTRERFTMDDGLSDAVRKVFIQLYDEGLIYRGTRLVNWDPKLKTAVSDLEVNNTEEDGYMWHIRYPLKEGGELVVATTRPETMLGDTAVAVSPEDERYKAMIGQEIYLPLTDRTIPLIADDYCDKDFGTGAVKITPAHDFNDYEVGKRNNLPMINIFNEDATLNESAPAAYQGMDRFEARKQILKDLEAQGFLVKIDKHKLSIPRAERGNTIIEPRLSDQWYVKIAPLAEPALKAVKEGEIKFVPENAANLYYRWMEDIQDWCISRQLWWGHRIPAWYDHHGDVYVGDSEADVRKKYNITDDITLTQEEDVLDTWFSSALWPFSTLGWPEKTAELEAFYPTSVLVTGFDIIFFWVARMIMFGMKFMDDVPFKTVYIHGLIRDQHGQKMSKSKGNVIDPVDLIDGISLDDLVAKRTANMMQPTQKEKITKQTQKEFPEGIKSYGCDALRFTYTALASTSRDIVFDISRMEGYRNFCNKLFNATRYVLMNVEEQDCGFESPKTLSLADHWIHSKLDQAIGQCHKAISEYRFDHLATTIYEFVWNDYCDWYLELSKVVLNSSDATDEQKAGARHTLITVLESILRLAHPVIPFITESLWANVKGYAKIDDKFIMTQSYPKSSGNEDVHVVNTVSWLQDMITQLRTIRAELNVPPKKSMQLLVEGALDEQKQLLVACTKYLQHLAKVETLKYIADGDEIPASSSVVLNNLTLYVPIADLIDVEAEKARLNKHIEKSNAELAKLKVKLSNANFTDKAPAAVVEKERAKLTALEAEVETLKAQLQKL